MSESHYGAIVIGAGPGGYPCAIRLGQLGVRTLIVEQQWWGGVCLNVGCIPSKALITAAKKFEEISHAKLYGFQVPGPVLIDATVLQKWKGEVVGKLTGGVKTLLKANKVDSLEGKARIVAEKTIVVATAGGEKRFTADSIVIATGSSPIEVPGFAFSDSPAVLDSTGALALDRVPERLVVIGGGYIGLEMSGVYAKLGCKVTVVEMMDQLLPGFDPDVVKVVDRRIKKDGATILLKTKAIGWEQAEKGIVVEVETPKGREKLPADHVLVTVGRRPNSKNLGIEALGVVMDGAFIKVDRQLRTNIRWLYAIGDVAGNPMLAHKATHDGEVAAEVIHGRNVTWDAKTVPAVVFTDPEIATAGLTEPECKRQGLDIKVGKVPFAAIGRAIANNESDGFVKVIIDAKSHLVLGVTIVGYHASDIISEAALAIEMGAEALDIGLTIHPHPTLGEGVMEAAKAALGEAIHVVNK